MTDQSTWPPHLRDDAPRQQCGRCGRYTWSPSEFGRECRMTQPDGYPCGGRFEPVEPVLGIFMARVGEPIPTDVATPLPASYMAVGSGKTRLTQKADDHFIGGLTRVVTGVPLLTIVWTDGPRLRGWFEANTMYTIVGQGTDSGWRVRAVFSRATRLEFDHQEGAMVTTAELLMPEPGGSAARWYFARDGVSAGVGPGGQQ